MVFAKKRWHIGLRKSNVDLKKDWEEKPSGVSSQSAN